MPETISIQLPPELAHDEQAIRAAISASFGGLEEFKYKLISRSLDARKKVKYVLRAEVFAEGEDSSVSAEISYEKLKGGREVYIIGAGPAGLFAALRCIDLGMKPIIIERGKDVRARRRDIAALNKEHIVNPESNYCFGEGGAGAYSDGKLYTRSKKRGDLKQVLASLVYHGADERILIDAHPHIGTNKLPAIITAIRETIESCGGEVKFDCKLTDIQIENNAIKSIEINGQEVIDCDRLILATGHSARDIFELMRKREVEVEYKPFALGVRVEHPQSLIDRLQYKMKERGEWLPPASYSLVCQVDGAGVYSFCMCPGGIIAPCATEQEEIVTNGWSPSKRNNPFANSGMVVQIEEQDLERFKSHGEFRGLEFQRMVEHKAWEAGGKTQTAPAQRLKDFVKRIKSVDLPVNSYHPGVKSVELAEVLPARIYKALQRGFVEFGKKMPGYLTNEAIVVATESRTSSPVRIPRNRESLEHIRVKGLYPCGEGAGYAGGIVSAAIDGQRCAQMISEKIQG